MNVRSHINLMVTPESRTDLAYDEIRDVLEHFHDDRLVEWSLERGPSPGKIYFHFTARVGKNESAEDVTFELAEMVLSRLPEPEPTVHTGANLLLPA